MNLHTADATDDERDLVVGNAAYDDTLIILPRSAAEYLRDLEVALGSATWGELRRNCSAEIYAEVLGQAGYGSIGDFLSKLEVGQPVPGALTEALRAYAEKAGEPLPGDEDPFDAEEIGSYVDGDFPPAAALLMLSDLPEHVIEEFGEVYETNFNGTFVSFYAEQREQIIRALEQAGFRCTNDQALIDAGNAGRRLFAR